ncbi:MAG: FKBP-type peptidyl-prolyl cis-trans isomerase [Gemmatimonadetes bacterium]|nr:FKBP-type peptidyl-prolyl cis-trans isomerase [Gemmatimonadota bacterium]
MSITSRSSLRLRVAAIAIGAASAILVACENPAAGNQAAQTDPLTAQYDSSLHIDITQYAVTTNGAFTKDSVVGGGNVVATGKTISLRYVGRLIDGTIFDQDTATGAPVLSFTVGAGTVIKGFDEGVVGMRVGGKRVIIVPPKIGYGATPRAGIPGNSILIFSISLTSSN